MDGPTKQHSTRITEIGHPIFIFSVYGVPNDYQYIDIRLECRTIVLLTTDVAGITYRNSPKGQIAPDQSIRDKPSPGMNTVCPKSLVLFHIITSYAKLVKTSWTYSTRAGGILVYNQDVYQ